MKSGNSPTQLDAFAAELEKFAEERDWQQFHTPKNLAMALTAEAGELLEIFQWLTPEQSQSLDQRKRDELADELGDILIYLVRLAGVTGVDLLDAARAKLEKNKQKYPAPKVKGDPRKYTEY
ncbi:nucleotide pyrophosphohydrolase [Thioalkalivibrio sp. XN8]|uniref:nucleotide pyrophosphohydrolase n=1 Tax=Thioalkalivibrio sp. XN8 TaxID=2712863 RepID=UPI00197D2EA5|nr:nucleotide pyrophosphohydrolase [Thioalkalivibrio sp. XN8]